MSISDYPPMLDKDLVTSQGTTIVIEKAEIKKDVQTAMAKLAQALTIECHVKGDKTRYSYLFGLDKDQIVGSAGRILSKTGAKNVTDLNSTTLSKLKNLEVLVKNKGGKLYWY